MAACRTSGSTSSRRRISTAGEDTILELFPLLALGFFLGVRHATDVDHVVAVTTIVSRERSLWLAALIGGMWGVGGAISIRAAGAAPHTPPPVTPPPPSRSPRTPSLAV